MYIDSEFLDHLLNCMANQKFIEGFPEKDRKKVQLVIDESYIKARMIQNTQKGSIAYEKRLKSEKD